MFAVYFQRRTILNKQRDWLSPRSQAKASGWLQSAVTKTDVMLRCIFIVQCGITRFLCAMCVFAVRTSSSSPRLPLCTNFVSFAASIAEIAHGEKSHTQSLNQLLSLFDGPETKAYTSL